MRRFPLIMAAMVLTISSVTAQEIWSLERCIREALDRSLVIRQFELNKEGYDITGKQLRMERLPSLNASTNAGVSFGRVINPATNDFETENSFYQSIGANSSVLLFNGFRLRNSIHQNNMYVEAAKEDMQQAKNDLALNVALAYLNVLFAYENVEIAQARVNLSNDQLRDLDILIREGARPENDRFDILAQVASDEQALITAQNNIEINMLSLKQQMWLEPDFPLEIERPELDLDALDPLENESFETVYNLALTTQPQIKASEIKREASNLGIDIARSQMLPTLGLGGEIGTNWSDLDREAIGFSTIRIPQTVYIEGQPVNVEFESETPTGFRGVPYTRQLDNNIGYGFGASLSIPIFNNYAAKANVEKAKINAINSGIETDKTKQTLKTNVQNALASARAAKKTLEAAEATVLAAQIALDNANRKTELGSIGNLEYITARNRFDTAENNRLIARYDYYFKVKVIEYYMGRGIQLN